MINRWVMLVVLAFSAMSVVNAHHEDGCTYQETYVWNEAIQEYEWVTISCTCSHDHCASCGVVMENTCHVCETLGCGHSLEEEWMWNCTPCVGPNGTNWHTQYDECHCFDNKACGCPPGFDCSCFFCEIHEIWSDLDGYCWMCGC